VQEHLSSVPRLIAKDLNRSVYRQRPQLVAPLSGQPKWSEAGEQQAETRTALTQVGYEGEIALPRNRFAQAETVNHQQAVCAFQGFQQRISLECVHSLSAGRSTVGNTLTHRYSESGAEPMGQGSFLIWPRGRQTNDADAMSKDRPLPTPARYAQGHG
jgi:hypothetical protein